MRRLILELQRAEECLQEHLADSALEFQLMQRCVRSGYRGWALSSVARWTETTEVAEEEKVSPRRIDALAAKAREYQKELETITVREDSGGRSNMILIGAMVGTHHYTITSYGI